MYRTFRSVLALALILLFALTACAPAQIVPTQPPAPAQQTTDLPLLQDEPASAGSEAKTEAQPLSAPDENGAYYDVENVVRYLAAYGRLPGNFITKNAARDLGWNGGSVESVRPGAAIGGDRFGNREGLLPQAKGRTYTECDIDTEGASGRGAKRLVFSNDGLFFYTDDHYESFTELTLNERGEVVWN